MTISLARAPRAQSTRAIAVMSLWCLGIVFAAGRAVAQPAELGKIQHVIVIYQENWSFDGLYGKFPGAGK